MKQPRKPSVWSRVLARVVAWVVFGMLGSLGAGSVAAVELATVEVSAADAALRLGAQLQVIADPAAEFSSDDILAGRHDAASIRLQREPPSLGYPRHPYWLRLRLRNDGDLALERMLVLWRGSKHAQRVHIEQDGGVRQLSIGPGSDAPSGDLRSRHAVVRLELPAHSITTLSIRLDTRLSTVLDYRLLSAEALARMEWRDQWLFGALLGFGAAISAFVLLLALRTREPTYGWFVPASVGAVAYVLLYEGLLVSLLQLSNPWLVRWLSSLFGVGSIVCFIQFNRRLLDARQTFPRLDRWMLRPLAIVGALLVLLCALQAWPFMTLGAIWALLAVIGSCAVFLWAAIRGRVHLRGFALAVTLFLVVTVVYSLQLLAIVPDIAAVHALRILALAASFLLFSFAVSERLRQQQEAAHLAVKRSELQLQQTVDERTRELSAAKERAESALQELQATQGQLVAAEKLASLGQLVAGVAHEINTPLGVALTASSYLGDHTRRIAGRLEGAALARSELTHYLADADEASRMIGANLERAANLIRSFKQVSVDRSSDDRRSFDLCAYLDDLVESLQPSWKRRPIELHVDCPADIKMDSFPGALGQVVSNLIQNALVHAFEDESTGNMWLRVSCPDQANVLIHFRDDGRGIDADQLPRIFDPFYTTRRGQGGTGLGLHITFNLVTQKLGGRIEAFSTPGHGTRFDIHLPLRAPAS